MINLAIRLTRISCVLTQCYVQNKSMKSDKNIAAKISVFICCSFMSLALKKSCTITYQANTNGIMNNTAIILLEVTDKCIL